jgi:hypothetical protein
MGKAGGMTIASYCLSLLSQRSPQTLEELTDACVAAGVTRSRTPLTSVKQALAGHGDVAPELPGGRYAYSRHLLDGRWFTTRCHDGRRLSPSFDLRLLQRLLAGRSTPLLSGGEAIAAASADGWAGPAGWLPEAGEVVGVRLRGDHLEVRRVDLDPRAGARGADLAQRLRVRASPHFWWPANGVGNEPRLWTAVLQLLAEDDDALRAPVPPLADLLPDMAHRPEARVRLGHPVTLRLPELLQKRLTRLATEEGTPLDRWLTDRLEEIASEPETARRRYGGRWSGDGYWDDRTRENEPGWDDGPWADVVPLGGPYREEW